MVTLRRTLHLNEVMRPPWKFLRGKAVEPRWCDSVLCLAEVVLENSCEDTLTIIVLKIGGFSVPTEVTDPVVFFREVGQFERFFQESKDLRYGHVLVNQLQNSRTRGTDKFLSEISNQFLHWIPVIRLSSGFSCER